MAGNMNERTFTTNSTIVENIIKTRPDEKSNTTKLTSKTKAHCKFFPTKNGCKNGDNCPFSHDQKTARKTRMCVYYLDGKCNNKDCPFLHDYPIQALTVKCKNGEHCENRLKGCLFYHHEQEKRQPAPTPKKIRYKTKMCSPHLCKGPECTFAHSEEEMELSRRRYRQDSLEKEHKIQITTVQTANEPGERFLGELEDRDSFPSLPSSVAREGKRRGWTKNIDKLLPGSPASTDLPPNGCSGGSDSSDSSLIKEMEAKMKELSAKIKELENRRSEPPSLEDEEDWETYGDKLERLPKLNTLSLPPTRSRWTKDIVSVMNTKDTELRGEFLARQEEEKKIQTSKKEMQKINLYSPWALRARGKVQEVEEQLQDVEEEMPEENEVWD